MAGSASTIEDLRSSAVGVASLADDLVEAVNQTGKLLFCSPCEAPADALGHQGPDVAASASAFSSRGSSSPSMAMDQLCVGNA